MSGPTISQRIQPPVVCLFTKLLSLLTVLVLLAIPPVARSQANPSSTPPEVTSLEVSKPIERSITGGEVHAYNLALKVDQYAHINLDQRGIDLAIWTFDPAGKKISEVDAFRVGEKEQIMIVSEVSGTYRIEVHTTFPKVPTGRYEITLPELRPATERDKTYYR